MSWSVCYLFHWSKSSFAMFRFFNYLFVLGNVSVYIGRIFLYIKTSHLLNKSLINYLKYLQLPLHGNRCVIVLSYFCFLYDSWEERVSKRCWVTRSPEKGKHWAVTIVFSFTDVQ